MMTKAIRIFSSLPKEQRKEAIKLLINLLSGIIRALMSYLKTIPEEERKEAWDTAIDAVEAHNSDSKSTMAACKVLRIIVRAPDEPEEIDQKEPI